MDLLQPPPPLHPTLILAAWSAVLGLLAVAFVLLLRWVRHDETQEQEHLLALLAQADAMLAGFEARERAHLQEITRLRRRLAELETVERAA